MDGKEKVIGTEERDFSSKAGKCLRRRDERKAVAHKIKEWWLAPSSEWGNRKSLSSREGTSL